MKREDYNALFEYREGVLFWKVDRGSNKVNGKKAGCPNKNGYVQVKINGSYHKVHHIVWLLHGHDIPDGFVLDHINGDPSDNRFENLRLATRQQNNCNARVRNDNRSGVKGVSWYAKSSKWLAQIQHKGKKLHVGLFQSIDDAVQALTVVRSNLHGEFSKS